MHYASFFRAEQEQAVLMELAEDLVLLKCNLITCVYEGAMVRVLALVLFLLLSGQCSLFRLFFVHNN